MKKIGVIVGLTALLGLSGCGYSTGERALSGAGIGALGGAGLAAATHGDPLTGAIVGGGLGAAAGAITAPRRHHYRGDRYYGGGRGRHYY